MMKFMKSMAKVIAIIFAFMVFMSVIEISAHATIIYRKYGTFEDAMITATHQWQSRLDRVCEEIYELSEEINRLNKGNVIEYPMCNKNISWNTLVRP